jgi:hypothetical protein
VHRAAPWRNVPVTFTLGVSRIGVFFMTTKRVNPDTGVIEERHIGGWQSTGERINLETGEHEERHIGGWQSTGERTNLETGEHEEKHIGGWQSTGERTNLETGEHEERHIGGWQSTGERTNLETGEHEERHIGGWIPADSSGNGPRHPPVRGALSRDTRSSSSHDYSDSSSYSTSEGSSNPQSSWSILMSTLISAGIWFVVSYVIAGTLGLLFPIWRIILFRILLSNWFVGVSDDTLTQGVDLTLHVIVYGGCVVILIIGIFSCMKPK